MMILDKSLSRLTIKGYTDREMRESVGTVVSMYNPDALQLKYQTRYAQDGFISSNTQSNTYQSSHPGELDLELILDARMPGNSRPLDIQLTELHELCYAVDPVSCEPHFLAVSWGKLPMGGVAGHEFMGRATKFAVSYTLFERDGSPLRASITLSLIADASIVLQNAKLSLRSPPVAVISVPDASTLPLIAAKSSSLLKGGVDYLTLADSNDLNSLNAIKPGQTLMAPALGGK
ncbi:hypothetical protein [Enterobacter roggenkampii]|uniref:CIS tube protein n=1 Tax=Enterobacter roggenkampii TaxID=1812935 RepID=UPI00084BEE22|nr:hypothetical protein [Enterobacter roggenkampii]AOP98019.1 hypothetical protein BFV67_22875 [Enterobacter roggenkampii]QWZ75380.1 hypothetical protein I6L60_23080 [Enterobacter roggenkampii]